MKSFMKTNITTGFLKFIFIVLISVIISILSIKAVQAAITMIAAEKTVVLENDVDGNGVASPGDILKYTVKIINSGTLNATGVEFNDTLDTNTTLIPDSLEHSPIAVPDVYPQTVLGNVRVDSSRIPFSVISNDNLGSPAITEIKLDNPTSAQGGNVTMVTSGANMGQFTYDPPAGFEGSDSFTYTLTNSVGSTTSSVTLTVSKMIWFVNNNASTCTTLVAGCGRLSKPFSSLSSLAGINIGTGNNPAANDLIFIYESNTAYTGAITLLEGQKLIGQDASTSLATLLSVIPASSSDTLPSMNINLPNATVGSTVTVNNKVKVQGLKIVTSNNTGINDPGSTISEVTISEVSVTSTGGTGVQFSNISGTFAFDNITVSNSPNGIVLENLTSTSSFAVPAGAITNTSSDGIRLSGANNVTISNITITDPAKFSTNPSCNFTSISSTCEAGVEIFGSNNISLSNLTLNHNNSGMQGIVAQNTSNLTIKNSQILNVGDGDNESGMLLNNLSGNLLLEDISIQNPKEFGIRLFQTTGNLSGILRRVTVQNNNSTFGEDGLSIRVEGGTSTILVDDADFLSTGGSGAAASVQGNGAILNLTLQNTTWNENHQLPHAVSFMTAGNGEGNITIQNNTMSGCANPANCFGVIDLDASDSSRLNATITGNTSTNSGGGNGIEFIVNDNASGKAAISNNSFTIQADRLGMNFMARSAVISNSTGRLDLTLTANTINGVSSSIPNVIPGIYFQSGNSTGTDAQTLCVNLVSPAGGNTINGSNTFAYHLRQRTGTTFQLQGLTGSGTNEANVEAFVKANNPSGTLSGNTDVYSAGGTTIVNYSHAVCLTPVSAPVPASTINVEQNPNLTQTKPEQNDQVLDIQDFNNPPKTELEGEINTDFMSTKAISSNLLPTVNLGILPAGSSVSIQYQVTINNPLSPVNTSQVLNQGSVNYAESEWPIFTDDPTLPGFSDPTVILLPKPDLTATKTNSASGVVTLPTPWNWNIRVENAGNFQAEIKQNDLILTDQLPTSGLIYTNLLVLPESVGEKVNCSITDNQLTCTATADFALAINGSFDISFDVTPTTPGLYTNPISTGICKVNPDNTLIELDFENNICSDSVTVQSAPIITSADSVDFVYNTPSLFTVHTTAGYPTDTVISLVGTLPDGITFTNLGNGSATIAGTPTTTGRYDLTFKATNGAALETTQTFTLQVNQAPMFTSGTATTFTTGSETSYIFSTVGYPAIEITFSSDPALPGSITLTDNGDGTATLKGSPTSDETGVYTLTLTATNGISPDATQLFTLTIGQQPSITSANNTTFVAGTSGMFTINSSGYPYPAISLSGSLPSGVTFMDNADGTATLNGTPATGTGGQYALVLSAANGIPPDASQNFTLTVQETPVFTSTASADFNSGSAGTFTISTVGYPVASLSYTSVPELPASLSFLDNGNGTATISGTPTAGDGGVYTLTLTATNGVLPNGSQTLVVSIGDGPAITSANNATFVTGSSGSFTITSAGYPYPAINYSGSLPSGVNFMDNTDGTATLSGTPAAGTGGQYSLVLSAANGILPDATQNFTLTVQEAPAFTSDDNVSFTTGVAGSFTITSTGYPVASISYSSIPDLPTSLSIIDNGDGTATLEGTPLVGEGGVYILTLTATNQVKPDASQTFTLSIGQQPVISSANHVTFVTGTPGSFTISSSGYPHPAISHTGSLPSGITFKDNADGTATLSGTPAAGTGGQYSLVLASANGILPDATQNFTLTVQEAPDFTSDDNASFTAGISGSFTFTTSGYPDATISYSSVPDLPTNLTFTDNGDGTASLSGTPQAGDGGVYTISLVANNGIVPQGNQTFTLTINESAAFTNADTTTFVEGNAGSFTITTVSTPVASISLSGELPEGVTFSDQGDGTAILHGSPAIGSAKSYQITLIAANGVGEDAIQEFVLVVQATSSITTINSFGDSGDGILSENEHTNVAITKLLVTFSEMMDQKSVQDVSNYSLKNGENPITIDSVSYDTSTKTTTLDVNTGQALPDGEYKLTINGEILDDLGYPMGDEFTRIFVVDTISISVVPFGFTLEDGTILKDDIKLTRSIATLEITFDEQANNPSGDDDPDDVTNPDNYLLVQAGVNGKFDTVSCEIGLVSDDLEISIGSIVYEDNGEAGPFKSKLTVNNGKPLPNGLYRLFVCGSTSITDLAGNKLNSGSDQILSFSIQVLSAIESLPATGFAPGKWTNLVAQPVENTYQAISDLWLEFPTQGIQAPITGVPWKGYEWNLTWLHQQVGWLEGTAYPTWNGNTVLTAHAYRADGLPGPFAYLKNLKYGDSVVIHYSGMKYTYEIRSVSVVSPTNTGLLSKSERNDWITLITCQQFDERTQTYLYRTIARAVLVQVEVDR